ncbi:MAG TPA: hypothetical protein V6C97_31160 [Oculatellaceae cyanobacterium]
MNHCEKCGKSLLREWYFCPNCGKRTSLKFEEQPDETSGMVSPGEPPRAERSGRYGHAVRRQVLDILVKKAIAGTDVQSEFDSVMKINCITDADLKGEVDKRRGLSEDGKDRKSNKEIKNTRDNPWHLPPQQEESNGGDDCQT